jgi:cell division protein FtsQ
MRSRQKYRNRFQRTPENIYANIKSWTDRIIKILSISLVILIIYAGYLQLNNPKTLPFHSVKIEAPLNFVNPAVLQAAVQSNLFGGFFSLDVKRLQQSLLNIPWVRSVHFRRIWPSKLVITVREYQPLALWGANGVISESGAIFYPEISNLPKHLPVLYGEPQYAKKIVKKYQVLEKELQSAALAIGSLTLTPRMAWQLRLSNGILVTIGRKNIDQRLQQFVQLYPRIIGGKANQALRVDLRYPNGFAVKWKNG